MQETVTDPKVDMSFFEVGFEPMDELHREFRDLVVALAAPEGGDYGALLLALHEHLLQHCAIEEQWMKGSDFPSCACHRQEHEMLLEVISEVRRRCDAGDVEVVQRLAAELPRWFEIHANTMDAALAFHLREHGVTGRPAGSKVEPLGVFV
jgi:hemerythrin-like metal-binding protein